MGTVRRATPHLLLAVWVAACGADNAPAPAPGAEAVAPAAPDAEWFVDRAAEAGLDFVHFNGMTGEFYQPEMAGPGAGLFDYDNDGDLDVYLVQGELLGDGDPLLAPPADHPPGDRLFRNDLEIADDGKRTLRFTDVTEAAGIAARGYGMGVAAGDVDNDGWVDLYLTRFGRNRMLRNQGDGTFVDVTSRSGTGDPAWGVPASFFDYDRDGWLDLFVGNYLSYTLESHTQCYDRAGAPDYCPPETSRPHPNVLYRNRGDGTFEDVTAAAGLGREFGLVLMATRFYDAAAAAFATPCYWDAGYNQTGPWFENATIVDTGTGIQTNNYWGDIWVTPSDRRYPNASLSYVTGSHNFKVGMQWSFGNDGDTRNRPGHINMRPRNGLPQPCDADLSVPCEDRHYITANNYPTSWNTTVRADRGIYVQDTWTLDRLTINAGVRYDHFESLMNTFRTGDLGGGRFISARSAPELPATPYWNDIVPRFSVVYDLFGDARTAPEVLDEQVHAAVRERSRRALLALPRAG